MLIISFDAVGDDEFERLAKYPAVAAFIERAAVYRGVPTVFLSNTYPVHTSVATGVMPGVHGVISNTEPFPRACPYWVNREDAISARTLWQAAAARGIDTAAVFWPVTAYSKTIKYNIPEVLARPGRSQILTSLAAGSRLLQLKMLLRHRALLRGTDQPQLDDFATACMTDILREHRPGLALIHLTAYDTLCHRYGKRDTGGNGGDGRRRANGGGDGRRGLTAAFEALDRNLAVLLEAAGSERDVVIFSDHSQLDVHTFVDPNAALAADGLIRESGGSGGGEGGGYKPGGSGCFFECCGGSAFFHAGGLPPDRVARVRADTARSAGFRRFLTEDETRCSGHNGAAFGFCAQAGYCYGGRASSEKANHGYPADMPGYKVFYMVRGRGVEPGVTHAGDTDDAASGGASLLDIAPLVARRLGLDGCFTR